MSESDRPLDVAALMQWPAVMLEEAMRFPETLRQMRMLLAEQVRLYQNINETNELLLRVAKRFEEADPAQIVQQVREAVRTAASPLTEAADRMDRVERTVDEMRGRMMGLLSMVPGARAAIRAWEAAGRGDDERD